MRTYKHIQEAIQTPTNEGDKTPTSNFPISHHTPTGRIDVFMAKQNRDAKRDERINKIGIGLIIGLGAGALLAAGGAIVTGTIEHAEQEALVRYQDGAVLGDRPLVSFTVPDKANVHDHASVDDEGTTLTLTAGDRVLCAPEMKMPDGQGHMETWALVQKEKSGKGGYGFVKIGEGSAVEEIANPASCPDEATVVLNPDQTNSGTRYRMQGPDGMALSPDFGVVLQK